MTVFPPYATILRWRGKGNFKQSSDVASKTLKTRKIVLDEGNFLVPTFFVQLMFEDDCPKEHIE